jgi:hypothetical protein
MDTDLHEVAGLPSLFVCKCKCKCMKSNATCGTAWMPNFTGIASDSVNIWIV